MSDPRYLRIDLSGLVFWLFALMVGAFPFLRGLFFEPDLLPSLVLLAGLFALYAADRLNARAPWLPAPGAAEWAAAVLVAVYGAAFLWAADRRAALVGFLEVLACGLAFVLARDLCRPAGRGRALLRAVFLSGVGMAVLGFVAASGLLPFPGAFVQGRLASFLQYPNALGGWMAATSLLGIGLWSLQPRGTWPVVYAAGTGWAQLALLASQSRGAWVLYPLAFAALLALLPREARGRAVYLQTAALGLALVAGARAMPALAAGQVRLPLLAVAAAGAGGALAHVAARAVEAWVDRRQPPPFTLQLLRWGGLAYAAAVGLGCVIYLSTVPLGATRLAPGAVLERAEAVTATEPSATFRRMWYRDALRLMGERPLLGAGGGGWEVLYHRVKEYPYWTTEVHNHFLQVGVETGLVGLGAFLAFWVAVGRGLWRLRAGTARRPLPPRGVGGRGRPAGPAALEASLAAAAGFGLLAHGAIDFDLSLPALSLILWALAGAVRAAELEAGGHAARAAPLPGRRALAWALAGWLVAAVLAYPAARLAEARELGARAAEAFRQGRLGEARALYERAVALDPWRGVYAVDLAQVHLVRQLAGFDALGFERAAAALEHALRVQPYRLEVRGEAVRLYALMGQTDRALEAARGLVWIAPTDLRAYGAYAAVLAKAAFERLEQGRRVEAGQLLERVFRLERAWQARVARWRRLPPRIGVPASTDPQLTLARGQAYFLMGYLEDASRLLRRVQGGALRGDAIPWLAASEYLQGREERAARLLAEAPDPAVARRLFARLLAVHGFAGPSLR